MENSAFHSKFQHTLAKSISFSGVGLHSGQNVTLTIHPAKAFTGFVFVRTDCDPVIEFAACAANVGDTKLGTSLNHPTGKTLSTIEHLMAAFWGAGIDNARIEVHGGEIPIMDGSSQPFLDEIALAGVIKQNDQRHFFEVEEKMTLTLEDSVIEILPYDGIAAEVEIEFDDAAIGYQRLLCDFEETSFSNAVANSRTFGFHHEVEYLQSIGLARGGSLNNAIVLKDSKVLNPEGLRSSDEFVRHKLLDLMGDLFLCGGRIKGMIRASKPGHTINTAMARQLIESTANSSSASKVSSAACDVNPAILQLA